MGKKAEVKESLAGTVVNVPFSDIRIDKDIQPRTELGDVTALRAGIKAAGLLQPIVLTHEWISGKDARKYVLVCGARRFAAMVSLGKTIPSIIRGDLQTATDAFQAAVVENLAEGRHNLSPLDLAKACAKLKGTGLSLKDVGAALGLNYKRVERCLTLLEAPAKVKEDLAKGTYSEATAQAFTKLSPEQQERVYPSMHKDVSAKTVGIMGREAEQERKAERTPEEKKAEAEGKPAKKARGRKKMDPKLHVDWVGRSDVNAKLAGFSAYLADTKPPACEEKAAQYYLHLGAVMAWLWEKGVASNIGLPATDAAKAKLATYIMAQVEAAKK